MSIKDWKANPEWEPIDTGYSDEEWLWHGITECDGTQETDPAIEGPHELDGETGACTNPDHGTAVSVGLVNGGTVGLYAGSALCFTMDAPLARFLVERMDPEGALRWAGAHAVRRAWGMPYRVDAAAGAQLLEA